MGDRCAAAYLSSIPVRTKPMYVVHANTARYETIKNFKGRKAISAPIGNVATVLDIWPEPGDFARYVSLTGIMKALIFHQ